MPLLLVGIGATELILIGLGIALLFGASRIPSLMRGMGQGIKEFKGALKDEDQPPAGAPPAPPTGGPGVNPTTSDETPG